MVLALFFSVVLAHSDAGAFSGAPAGLTCLPTWYAGTVSRMPDGGWGLMVGDAGIFLPWEIDYRFGDFDAGVDSTELTSLSDIYRPPYRTGPIVPIDTSDAGRIDDPGRARVEQLFVATYGASRAEVQGRLGSVRFFGPRYGFHQLAAPALTRVVARISEQAKTNKKLLPFVQDIGGTFIWRRIKGSPNLSTHAFGIAIDVNVERSSYWRWTFKGQPMVWKNKIPQEIVDAFEAEGFIWGGRWAHYDTMHFEYRPELISPLCQGEPAPTAE